MNQLSVATNVPLDKPTVVCLCGSTRYMEAFHEANRRETLAGKIVLTVEIVNAEEDAEHYNTDPKRKRFLDELHLRKIDLADEILVLNVAGYIGPSTGREIVYAMDIGKRIRWLEPNHLTAVAPDIATTDDTAGEEGSDPARSLEVRRTFEILDNTAILFGLGIEDSKQLRTALLAFRREQPALLNALWAVVAPLAPVLMGDRVCRQCGCTDFDACDEGCDWAKEDLCSACIEGKHPEGGGRDETDGREGDS